MDQIQRLALRLKEAQQKKTSNYLPERYCVDLINLSSQRGFLKVIHTADGKEYVTPVKLRREICDKISENGGRINILLLTQVSVYLNKLLNVDRSHVLKYTKEICAASEGKIYVLNDDEIINNVYLDRIAQETQDVLETKGIMHYNELTTRFGLPLDFLLNVDLS
ncbi:E3 UFM1-protein ligase 1 [Thelohanellus kitauei]|uniref:E3 UFM1-protein ligase 1 n=1 Tax=Thelohanellus kitauei TaxID=669202 RepID=A0A0C2J9P7_THEKT|nr:E3 UFM1-protein ligase 1 [Thelohanellus kitauei]